ncbi:hypothetical protein HAHI6034_12900 [Hathewaya histolytica]|uniref:Uncharacterized protein n=1 Tax=Hathewaya histolytica TaxID=1498 RepID=A0A4V6Z124_HATHI|nr:hypothetical protein [Hathewaya histolytica]VTQ81727.1 Uncharacterised protein [Hathewaya histolytica]
MKHTNQKIVKLISELTSFCYKYEASKVNIDIENKPEEVEIRLNANIKDFPMDVLETVRTMLSAPRSHEIEECYWNLSGDDDTDSELVLVGMMVDYAEIDYNQETRILNFNLIRKL